MFCFCLLPRDTQILVQPQPRARSRSTKKCKNRKIEIRISCCLTLFFLFNRVNQIEKKIPPQLNKSRTHNSFLLHAPPSVLERLKSKLAPSRRHHHHHQSLIIKSRPHTRPVRKRAGIIKERSGGKNFGKKNTRRLTAAGVPREKKKVCFSGLVG